LLEDFMKKTAVVVALAAVSLAMPGWAATDAECQDMWKKADANSDGVLSDKESIRYVAFMRLGNRAVATQGRITQAEFMDACKADIYAPRKADEGAPLKGANSFTEDQARDRAMAHGNIESVASLKKDDDGIWRGMAMQGGKEVQVAVDYKGNVVTIAKQ
jgi:outer membrane lipoprotein SlyB